MIKKLGLMTLLFFSNAALSIGLPPSYFTIPLDMDQVNVSLITIDLGDTPEKRFGHTLLRIEDGESNKVHHLNWGTFSFKQPRLYWRYFTGKLKYWVSNWPTKFVIYKYRKYEKRSVYSNRVHLTSKQKRHLMNLVYQNFQGDKIFFNYNFFYENCSTIPRDLLNLVLQGAVYKNLQQEVENRSYRWYVRNHLNTPPVLGFATDLVLNSEVDVPMTKWQESFYPLKLKEHLASLPALDDDGKKMRASLLGEDIVLFEGVKPISSPYNFASMLAALFVSLMLLISVFTYRQILFPFNGKKSALQLKKRESVGFRLFGFMLILWGLFSFVSSATMIMGWVFSAHTILNHNANLLLMWPLDILYAVIGSSFLIWGTPKRKSIFSLWIYRLSVAHILAGLCFFVLFLTGGIKQDVSQSIRFILPVMNLMFAFTMAYLHVTFSSNKLPPFPSSQRVPEAAVAAGKHKD